MKKIKVLMVLGNTRMGGTQMFILNVLRNIDLERYQIDVAINFSAESGGIDDELKKYGCQIYYWPYFKVLNYFRFVRFWKKFFENHHYDIVHAHSTNSASIYLKVARLAGCVTIGHSHSTGYRGSFMQKQLKRYFAKKVGNVADYWFACSDDAARRLYGEKFKKFPQYYEIPNAINASSYLYNKKKAQNIRNQIGVKDGEFLCGHVGTFSAPKNHLFLIDIFAEILKYRPNSRLICCGTGILMPTIKEKARMLGVLNKIIFTGVVNNCNEYLMAMDVMIFPSLFEGFGFAVLEAEATGLPVVMSDVIPKDVDLTNCIHRMSLAYSPTQWAEMACSVKIQDRFACNTLITESKYNMRTSIKLISSLYEEMVKNK